MGLQADRPGGAKQMSALLSINGVSKRFRGLVAVDRVSFEVPEGGVFAVIGPNGAGKTTLLHMIAGGGDGTAIGRKYSGDHVKQRGVAGAVRTDDRENAALGHLEADPVDRDQAAEAFAHAVDR